MTTSYRQFHPDAQPASSDDGVPNPVTDGPTRADLLVQITDLQRKLATMPQIEQAKGALMLVYGLTDDEAFALLRRYSQNSNTKLRALAAALTTHPQRKPLGAQAQRRLTRLLQATIADRSDPTSCDKYRPPS